MGSVRATCVAWFVCGAVTGCSTTATITRRDGTSIEGRIEGGTGDSIVVDPRIGDRREIPRSDIAEIDHPGNVHLLVGGIVFGYGGIYLASTYPDCDGGGHGALANCTLSFAPVVAGLAVAIWGLSTWMGSKEAAAVTTTAPLASQPKPRSLPTPPASPAFATPDPAPSPVEPAAVPPAPAPPDSDSRGEPSHPERPPAELPPAPAAPGVSW